tara:strand:+ start:46 stop:534 length:489 start_codon:yes stop_codon:yes gene_type:complete
MKITQVFRALGVLVLLIAFQLIPLPALACVEGLSWGMDLHTVEGHLGVTFEPAREVAASGLFEVRNFQMSDLPVKRLRLRFEDHYGLKQLVYEMDYEHMPEVLGGLRHRFGPPVGTSVDIEGEFPQQQWIWHTGEDVITAIKTDKTPFLLSYRPSLLDPSFL